MSKFKIGDRVRDASGFFARCYNKPDVEGVLKVRNACGRWEIDWDGIVGEHVNWGNDEIELVVSRDEPTGPVTIETVKRINGGVYGIVTVCTYDDTRVKVYLTQTIVRASELRAAADVFTQLADALEGE